MPSSSAASDRLARRIGEPLVAQHQLAEPELPPRQDGALARIPGDGVAPLEAIGERRLDLGQGQRRREEDPRLALVAVEIGDGEEIRRRPADRSPAGWRRARCSGGTGRRRPAGAARCGRDRPAPARGPHREVAAPRRRADAAAPVARLLAHAGARGRDRRRGRACRRPRPREQLEAQPQIGVAPAPAAPVSSRGRAPRAARRCRRRARPPPPLPRSAPCARGADAGRSAPSPCRAA